MFKNSKTDTKNTIETESSIELEFDEVFKDVEMERQPINLNFDMSDEQIEAYQMHLLFKQKGVYDTIKRKSDDIDYTHVCITYKSMYNDNTYDVDIDSADLLLDGKVVCKFLLVGQRFETYSLVGEEYTNYSFIINKKML